MRFSTRAIRVGQSPDPLTGSVTVPIYQTVNYVFDDVGQPRGYEYSRTPTRRARLWNSAWQAWRRQSTVWLLPPVWPQSMPRYRCFGQAIT